LQVAEKLNFKTLEKVPNLSKFRTFLMNLDQRLKLTAFVMIQRIDDDEKLERIAK